MKTRILLVLLVPVLWSCATVETRPAVDASIYLFELDVDVDPQLAEFDPNVAKGGGSGMLRGAGMGAGGCIYAGASIDAASAGSSLLLGTALGIFVSPACAVVGAMAGGAVAETKEDVAARVKALNDLATELDYPSDLARLLAEDLKSGPIYHIAQSSDEIHSTPVIPVPQYNRVVDDSFEASTKVVIALAHNNTEESDPFFSMEEEAPALATHTVVESSVLPFAARPTQPNAKVRLNITGYGLTGAGIDPKLPMQLSATLCVTQYATGEALVYQPLRVASKAMKLEDWAALGVAELEAETHSLIDRLSDAAQAAMSKQVKLTYKTSCK